MSKNKKITLIISIALVSIILLIGVTYALTYTQTSTNQELVLGDIYMRYNEISGLSITDAVPGSDYSNYFEFTISGKNTYTKKDIYYDFILNRGDLPTNKTEDNRIPDKYLKFKLVSVDSNNQETEIFTDKTYASLESKRIHVETIEKNTTSEVNKKYRLYMTIDNSLLIGNTSDAVFTFDEFENAFGSVKVNVTGDFTEKEIIEDSVVEVIKANKVTYEKASADDFTGGLVAINGSEGVDKGILYNENDETHVVSEYKYSGSDVDNYIYYNCKDTVGGYNYGDLDYDYEANCEIWRIIGVFNENGEEFLKIMNNKTITNIPTTYLINAAEFTVGYNGTTGIWNNGIWPASGARAIWFEDISNDWAQAGLQYYLNTEHDESTPPVAGYLSTLSTNAKNLIRETTYYLGNTAYDTDTTTKAYQNERKNIECSSDVTSKTHNNNCNIWNGNQATWTGKVALLYLSDYGYSANPIYWNNTKLYNYHGDSVKVTSWMMQTANHNAYEWLLSPSSFYSTEALIWDASGIINSNSVDLQRNVRPVLNLKSNIKVLKGDGDINSPYVVIEG